MDETEDMLDLSYSEYKLSEINKSDISPQNRIRASQAERGSGQGRRLRRSAAAMTVPGPNTATTPISVRASTSPGGTTPPTTTG